MAPVTPEMPPGSDDGASRPGVGMRRTVIVVISGLLLISIPAFLLIVWGMMLHPSFGPGMVKPVTSTLTISLSIPRSDWSRLVQAADRFAIQHDLVDSQAGSIMPASDLRLSRVRYEGKDADLAIEKMEASGSTLEIQITIREFSGSGGGQRLKAAFENDVVRTGRFFE